MLHPIATDLQVAAHPGIGTRAMQVMVRMVHQLHQLALPQPMEPILCKPLGMGLTPVCLAGLTI